VSVEGREGSGVRCPAKGIPRGLGWPTLKYIAAIRAGGA
jgi:hypothetical protein